MHHLPALLQDTHPGNPAPVYPAAVSILGSCQEKHFPGFQPPGFSWLGYRESHPQQGPPLVRGLCHSSLPPGELLSGGCKMSPTLPSPSDPLRHQHPCVSTDPAVGADCALHGSQAEGPLVNSDQPRPHVFPGKTSRVSLGTGLALRAQHGLQLLTASPRTLPLNSAAVYVPVLLEGYNPDCWHLCEG